MQPHPDISLSYYPLHAYPLVLATISLKLLGSKLDPKFVYFVLRKELLKL